MDWISLEAFWLQSPSRVPSNFRDCLAQTLRFSLPETVGITRILYYTLRTIDLCKVRYVRRLGTHRTHLHVVFAVYGDSLLFIPRYLIFGNEEPRSNREHCVNAGERLDCIAGWLGAALRQIRSYALAVCDLRSRIELTLEFHAPNITVCAKGFGRYEFACESGDLFHFIFTSRRRSVPSSVPCSSSSIYGITNTFLSASLYPSWPHAFLRLAREITALASFNL